MYFFGPLGAEADSDLLNYFHVTPQVKGLIDFKANVRPKFIVVARPGGGKTALRTWLQHKATADVRVTITSDKTRLYLEDEDSPNIGDLRLLTSSELFTGVIAEAVIAQVLPAKLQAEADQFIAKGWAKLAADFFNQKFSGISILGCGFSLKPGERRKYLQEIRRSSRLAEASALVKKIANHKKLILVVDNPEEIVGVGLNDVTPENAIRIGTFLSALHHIHCEGVRVVCFLKEQVLQAVRSNYPDFPHFSDQVDGLSWSAADLSEMLHSRVTTRLKVDWSQIFDAKPAEVADEIFPYLQSGPRDLLFLCNLAGKEGQRIDVAHLKNALPVLRSDRLKDLSAQYKQWPNYVQFVSAMISALSEKHKNGIIPLDGINSVFETQYSKPKTPIHSLRNNEWVDKARWEAPLVDERLFVSGIVGYISKGTKIYPWSGRDTTGFQQADSHFVSPLFSS